MLASPAPSSATPKRTSGDRVLLGVVVTSVAAALLAQLAPAVGEAWQWDPAQAQTERLWRLFACHLSHWSWDHLTWDLATFVGLALTCRRHAPWRTLIALACAAAIIPWAVTEAHPQLTSYRGLSGIDSALFVVWTSLVWQASRRAGDRVSAGLAALGIAGFLGKSLFEIFTGSTLFVDSAAAGFTPLPVAHLAGAAAGLAAAWLPLPPIAAKRYNWGF
ncbi:MAG: rhombosortase [Planctomycetales bacterium]|nr:rhombosortase [Planctomycetales bacterium]